MNILIAPNAFKGTLAAGEVASLIDRVVKELDKNVQTMLCPIADGGDGTASLLANSLGLKQHQSLALDAIGRPIHGFFALEGKRAFMDVSTVSGIQHLHDYQLDPWLCSTFGTGQLIKEALQKGATQFVVGLGGSATVDLGIGMLRALGYLFLDENGREIPVFSPGFLNKIAHIQSPIQKIKLQFTLLCDVNNRFFGEQGAIPVFGPQKGLLQTDATRFEQIAEKVCKMLYQKSGKAFEDLPGFGAAGGIALGLSAFFPVEIKMGAPWFFEQVNMIDRILEADLVITGEGRYDAQSAGGKGSHELLNLVKKLQKNIVLITSGERGEVSDFDAVWRLPDLDLDQPDTKIRAKKNLENTVIKGFEQWLNGVKK
ncbi:glycerate kinase family protein [Pararhodonellum marinum]|uniref:glycerate kinase family protein n=1 Tax=Pararhodonellum marinum TaxID=2755358 RepID=UPI00188EC669|nr:glycerate kinase [Pararhodonellum marinum]